MTDQSVTYRMSEPATEPRWRRLPEERPKQILDAALAVFGESGAKAEQQASVQVATPVKGRTADPEARRLFLQRQHFIERRIA